MSAKSCVPVLVAEHRAIASALDRLDESLVPFDAQRVEVHVAELARGVERKHNRKEDEVLIQALLALGGGEDRSKLLSCREEHRRVRRYLAMVKRDLLPAMAGDAGARGRVVMALTAFSEGMRGLMRREELEVYPLANELLSEQLHHEVLRRFEEIEAEVQQADDASIDETQDLRPPSTLLFADEGHRSVLLGSGERGLSVQTNVHLIVHGREAMLLDPGGPKGYPEQLAAVRAELGRVPVRTIFLSHEDPDVVGCLDAWVRDTGANAYISRIWMRFLPHFGTERLPAERVHPIPDEGMRVQLGGEELVFLPAHFLHSSGNFQVYDPLSKILYSGDLGASFGSTLQITEDFDALEPHLAGFHQRYMPGPEALKAWARMVRTLEIRAIAPQHGTVMRGAAVPRFISWCESLSCGMALLADCFRVPR